MCACVCVHLWLFPDIISLGVDSKEGHREWPKISQDYTTVLDFRLLELPLRCPASKTSGCASLLWKGSRLSAPQSVPLRVLPRHPAPVSSWWGPSPRALWPQESKASELQLLSPLLAAFHLGSEHQLRDQKANKNQHVLCFLSPSPFSSCWVSTAGHEHAGAMPWE